MTWPFENDTSTIVKKYAKKILKQTGEQLFRL